MKHINIIIKGNLMKMNFGGPSNLVFDVLYPQTYGLGAHEIT